MIFLDDRSNPPAGVVPLFDEEALVRLEGDVGARSLGLSVEGVHQFGSATLDESSPHYSDQAVDYANEVLHAPLFDEASLQQNLLRAYRPGAETLGSIR